MASRSRWEQFLIQKKKGFSSKGQKASGLSWGRQFWFHIAGGLKINDKQSMSPLSNFRKKTFDGWNCVTFVQNNIWVHLSASLVQLHEFVALIAFIVAAFFFRTTFWSSKTLNKKNVCSFLERFFSISIAKTSAIDFGWKVCPSGSNEWQFFTNNSFGSYLFRKKEDSRPTRTRVCRVNFRSRVEIAPEKHRFSIFAPNHAHPFSKQDKKGRHICLIEIVRLHR